MTTQQQGIECSIEGCADECVCNDLCHNHNMARYRYGDPMGKPEKTRRCKKCKKPFSHKSDSVKMCDSCRKAHRRRKNAVYVKRHREGKK